jgi:ubiquinone/menaquinone biosynthesis C-methylase UbiE
MAQEADGMGAAHVNLWTSAAHALDYLARADSIPHRTEGERAVLECLPARVARVLDLGTGDGRLLALVILAHPAAEAVAIDFSETMLDKARARFAGDPRVAIVMHDMDQPLPSSLGSFDAVVSSFAIHHLPHARKRLLYDEVHRLLEPQGVFCNLEHVASPTERLHRRFLAALDVSPDEEDPSNRLLDVETQLAWLREIGFADVDCHWKWRELALLGGVRST